jgi:paraquat-inducible protein A
VTTVALVDRRQAARWLALWNWLCHGLLAVGLIAPCMTYSPRLGAATEAARAAGLLPDPATYSVLSGILTLLDSGNALIGCVLLLFSVVFPISKLVVVRLALRESGRGALAPPLVHAVAAASKYSMVDVFVIALLVLASRTMPGGSRIELEWGVFAFCAAALLSTALTTSLQRVAAGGGGPAL